MYHIDINKLNGKIVERQMTKEGLAKCIGIDRSTLFRRIRNNKLLVVDLQRICEVLCLSSEEATDIFLAK